MALHQIEEFLDCDLAVIKYLGISQESVGEKVWNGTRHKDNVNNVFDTMELIRLCNRTWFVKLRKGFFVLRKGLELACKTTNKSRENNPCFLSFKLSSLYLLFFLSKKATEGP